MKKCSWPIFLALLAPALVALRGRLLAYDALDQSFRSFKVRRDPTCPACGEDAGPIVIAEYDDLCMPHPVTV